MEFIAQYQNQNKPVNTMQIPLSTKSLSCITKPPDSSEEWILVFDTETTNLPQNGWDDFEPYNTVEKWKDGNSKFTKTTMIRDPVTNAPVLDQYGKPKYNYVCKTVLATDTALYPHIIQFSYILFNRKTNETKIVNKIIQLDEEVYLSPISEAIHNISMKKSREKDKNGSFINPAIEHVLCEFMEDFYKADIIVAHNYAFDYQIIQAEMKRNYDFLYKQKCKKALDIFTAEYLETKNKRYYCTMQMSISICKLPFKPKTTTTTKINAGVNINPRPCQVKKVTYKFPKLSELHNHLFGFVPENLHDAQVDVETCLRCYKQLVSL
jgi:DNA polymerase III epsilon subunit-like protein